jgi:asparagine synthetase B (glutamine-hydrolysing)
VIRLAVDKKVSLSSLCPKQDFFEVLNGAGIAAFDERGFFNRVYAREALELYQRHELGALRQIASRGAVLVCDEVRQRLFLVADSAGHSTFYYLLRQGELIFSSRLQELDEYFRFDLSERSTDEYLACGFISSPLTVFDGVGKLPPGGYLLLENGRVQVSVCRKTKIPASDKVSDNYQRELEAAFESCLARTADAPSGLMLSGGYDSSLLGELLLRRYGRLRTWVVDMMGYNAATVRQAQEMSRILGTDHSCIPVSARDYMGYFRKALGLVEEPLLDLDFPVIRQAVLAIGNKAQYVWHGFGSDEVLGERVIDFKGALTLFAAQKGRSSWKGKISVRQIGQAFLATKVPQELRAHYRLCEASGTCLVFPFFEPELISVAARMPINLMKNKRLLRGMSSRLHQLLPVQPREERGQMPALIKHVLIEGHKESLLADSFLAVFIKKNGASAIFERKSEDLLLRMIVFLVWKQERDRRLSLVFFDPRSSGASRGEISVARD